MAERCPGLVRRIAAEGHEVASHGYGHRRVYLQSRDEFRQDIRRSKNILEELTGKPILGYRAPSYSISTRTCWAFEELLAAGYRYRFEYLSRFATTCTAWPTGPVSKAGAVQNEQGAWQPSDLERPGHASLFEIPITTLQLSGRNLPIAGGGYFRLFPYKLTCWGLRRINRRDQQPFVFICTHGSSTPGSRKFTELAPRAAFVTTSTSPGPKPGSAAC
ncbi:MAG: DUF3473 domain-containing protein [Syntrophotaleaceae bacterium]